MKSPDNSSPQSVDAVAESIRRHITSMLPSQPDPSSRKIVLSVYDDIEKALARGVAIDKIVADIAETLNIVPTSVRAYIKRERRQRRRAAKGARK